MGLDVEKIKRLLDIDTDPKKVLFEVVQNIEALDKKTSISIETLAEEMEITVQELIHRIKLQITELDQGVQEELLERLLMLEEDIDEKIAKIELKEPEHGKDGEDGKDADEERVIASVLEQIPIPRNGIDADESVIVASVLEQIREPVDGEMPDHEWNGTFLRFQKPDEEWGEWVNLAPPVERGRGPERIGPYGGRSIKVSDDGIVSGVQVKEIDFLTGFDVTGTNDYAAISVNASEIDHGLLMGLLDDDHTQYLLLAGRAGGQTAYGGTASGDDLVLESTSNATKGNVRIGDSLQVQPDGSAPGLTSFGVVAWPRGTRLYEQGGGGDPERFFYLVNGDRFELLNEAGSQFIFSARGSAAAQPNTFYMVGSMAIGSGYFNANTPLNGLIAQGNVGLGSGFGNLLTPSVQLHVREVSANETMRIEGGNDFGSLYFRTNYAGTNALRGLLGYEDATGGGWATDSTPHSMILRGEYGVGISQSSTLLANFLSTGVTIKKTLTTEEGRIRNVKRITNTDSPYTLLATDHELLCDTDAAAITVNLPAGVEGTNYRIINTGSSGNNVTLAPNGAELLDGVNANGTILDSEKFIYTYETTEGWW